jgi:hypothetical protein
MNFWEGVKSSVDKYSRGVEKQIITSFVKFKEQRLNLWNMVNSSKLAENLL